MAFFTSLDLNQGYLQIAMRPNDIQKTGFVVQAGFFEFTRMPVGLTNAPATFQRLMDTVLAGLKWHACLAYLDDIIVFGRTLDEHNQNLTRVFERLRSANLTLKPTKCAFAVAKLRFLVHVISQQGVQMDPEKVRIIMEMPRPNSVPDIKSFLGMASYYRNFVENFSKIAQPLNKLTPKDEPFVWSRDQEEAFVTLKNRMSTQPIVCHYDHQLPVELRTDACGHAIGAILLHVFPDKTRRVIAFASRSLTKCEPNYAITEKECLAIVWAVEKFRMYLLGVKFTVVTDHLALTWLNGKKELTGRLMRWTAQPAVGVGRSQPRNILPNL